VLHLACCHITTCMMATKTANFMFCLCCAVIQCAHGEYCWFRVDTHLHSCSHLQCATQSQCACAAGLEAGRCCLAQLQRTQTTLRGVSRSLAHHRCYVGKRRMEKAISRFKETPEGKDVEFEVLTCDHTFIDAACENIGMPRVRLTQHHFMPPAASACTVMHMFILQCGTHS
jgi:hypothetical protein